MMRRANLTFTAKERWAIGEYDHVVECRRHQCDFFGVKRRF
jgi:hypothetical protein